MKYLLKIFLFFVLFLCAMPQNAQVKSVQYAIYPNPETSLIDCFLFIKEGNANTARERVQFNAQYSLVVPTGAEVSIASSSMPLVHNQNFDGTKPLEWVISSQLLSPQVSPDLDFYGITPTLAPAGFYNTLSEGDVVKLFSVKAEGESLDVDQIRIYNRDIDPGSFDEGMSHGDFSNGFTMGGFHQLFRGIINIDELDIDIGSLNKLKQEE